MAQGGVNMSFKIFLEYWFLIGICFWFFFTFCDLFINRKSYISNFIKNFKYILVWIPAIVLGPLCFFGIVDMCKEIFGNRDFFENDLT